MGAGFDPFFENGDFAGRELGLGRHFELRIHVADRFDEQTRFELTGFDGRSVVAALDPAGARVQSEAAFDLGVVGVALKAALLEDGQDFGVEEGGVGCVGW